VLVGPRDHPTILDSLPRGARVGTSSLRRTALLRAFRADLDIAPIRGNLDTRIRKVDEGEFQAIVLAAAGLRRLGWAGRIHEILDARSWLPAPGQGALAIVSRSDDDAVAKILAPLNHPPTAGAVRAERALLARLEGGCQLPVGALATPYQGRLRLWGSVASPDGRQVVRADGTGEASDAEALGIEVAEVLRARGADSILDELRRNLDPGSSPPITPP
jgi:hydroxymethylbilane synthase